MPSRGKTDDELSLSPLDVFLIRGIIEKGLCTISFFIGINECMMILVRQMPRCQHGFGFRMDQSRHLVSHQARTCEVRMMGKRGMGCWHSNSRAINAPRRETPVETQQFRL